MPFEFHIDILDLIFKGLLIGVLASGLMGPVGILCVQRTLNKGRWYGFITGVGAALSDIIYALITGLGMSFLMDFISRPETLYILKISGSVVLLVFGIYSFYNNPTRHMHISGKQKGSYLYNGLTAFGLTLSNPLIVFLFIAAYAQFTFVVPDHPEEMAIGYLSIFGGAILWWFGLTWALDKLGGQFNANTIIIINKIIGGIVIVVAIIILFGTVFNLYSFTDY